MLKLVAFLAIVVVGISAQPSSSYVYQGWSQPQNLTNGVGGSAILPIGTDSSTGYNSTFFQVWIPENATRVNLTIVSNSSNSLTTWVGDIVLPCNSDIWSNVLCEEGESTTTSSSTVFSLSQSSADNDFYYSVGAWWYITSSRYLSSYYDSAFPVTILPQWTECPGPNGIAVNDGSSAVCSTYTNIVSGTQFTYSGAGSALPVFKLSNLTNNVGSVTIVGTANTSSLYIYGRSRAASNYGSGYNTCYQSSSGNQIHSTGIYPYTLVCPYPKSGSYYVVLENYYSNDWNANFTVTVNNCSATTFGVNCTQNATRVNFATLATAATFNVPYTTSSSNYEVYNYYYLDINSTFAYKTTPFIGITASSPASGYVYVRRDGFPGTASNYYDYYASLPTSTGTPNIILNNYDFNQPGRVYFGFECTTTTGCDITIQLNGTLPVTTTGRATTGSADDGSDSSSSMASVLVAPFIALILSMIAMF